MRPRPADLTAFGPRRPAPVRPASETERASDLRICPRLPLSDRTMFGQYRSAPNAIKRIQPMRGQILLLTVGLAVTGSNSLVLSPILPDVAQGLGTTPVVISRALAAYGGATALSAFLAPRIDRVGPRRALSVGMAALTAATT